MWYRVTAIWESGKTYRYEVKGMMEAMKRVARLKATDEVNANIWNQTNDKLVNCKIEKVEN